MMKKIIFIAATAILCANITNAANIDNYLPREFWQNQNVAKPIVEKVYNAAFQRTTTISFNSEKQHAYDILIRNTAIPLYSEIKLYYHSGQNLSIDLIEIPEMTEYLESLGCFFQTIKKRNGREVNRINISDADLHQFAMNIGNIIGKSIENECFTY